MARNVSLIGAAVLVAIAMSGCTAELIVLQVPSATPTASVKPTATPTATASPTPAPSATPTPTPTPQADAKLTHHQAWSLCLAEVKAAWKESGGSDKAVWPAWGKDQSVKATGDGSVHVVIGFTNPDFEYALGGGCIISGTVGDPKVQFQGITDGS